MKRSTLELWVGLFVVLGMVAIAFLALRVAGGNAWAGNAQTYTVKAHFGDIGGLKPKAPVKAAGVVVGRVSQIRLDTETFQAEVLLELDSQYRFSSDVSAEILTSGLLGEQYIGLLQGADEAVLQDGDTIQISSSALVLEQLIGKFMTNMGEKNADSTAPETP